MKEAQFYTTKDKKIVKCTLCSHFCEIANKKAGICHTRVNEDGKLFTLGYGFPAAINVDPIEKKPLFHFSPGSHSLSFGTYGCNFECQNCQNWDISQLKLTRKKVADLDFVRPEKIVENAIGDDCASISYTYNEPTIFAEYATDVMKLAHENGLKNVWVSNGYMSPECLDKILPYLDAINVDLKSFDPDFYKSNCNARLEPILENLKRLKNEQVHLEITTLLIPSLSADIEMLELMADFIASELDVDTPWHLSKFSPEISWKLKNLDSTGDDIIYEAYEIGKSAGLKYVYVGSIPGDQKENTYCSKCGELAIRRMGYHIERLDAQGACAYCDKSLDIVE